MFGDILDRVRGRKGKKQKNKTKRTNKKQQCSDLCATAFAAVSTSNNISKFCLPVQQHQLNNELSITAQNVIRLTDTSAIFSCTC